MTRPIFYPPCRWLDPNNRNFAGHFSVSFDAAMLKLLSQFICRGVEASLRMRYVPIAAREIVAIALAKHAQ